MAKGTTIRMWHRTVFILLLIIILGFGTVVFSLARLQLAQGAELKTKAFDNQLQSTPLTAQRGTIYDCNMKKLAESANVWDVILEPACITNDKDRKTISEGLSKILGLDKDDLLKKCQKKSSYYEVIKKKIEADTRDEILQFENKNGIKNGIRLVEDYKRYYPYGAFASTVLGFTGTDSQGLSGIEAQYDKYLTGVNGKLVTARNAVGADMPVDYEQEVKAQDGNSLVLTIDEVVQHALEKNLEEGLADNKVQNRGCAIVINVKTGAILGMAVKGDFDPNNPFVIADKTKAEQINAITDSEEKKKATDAALQEQWRNKCISDTYYPGSVFKMVTGASAMEENLVTENTPFNCPSYLTIQGRQVHDWKTFGHLTFAQGVCESSNVVFMQVGQMLGVNLFCKYFDAFGFTQKTGIDLPGESRSIYVQQGNMTALDLACASFGQTNKITPIQMITATCAVANGGYLVQPHIVSQIVDSKGNIVKTADTSPKRQVISKTTSQRMCKILEEDAKSGTASTGYIPGYRVAGKTGTSQKTEIKTSSEYIASYCGFAPADDPQVAMLVFYDEPHGSSYYGSPVAGPTFNKTMSEILPYLGVEPKYTDDELGKLDVKSPDVVNNKLADAKNKISKEELKVKVYGSGDKVVSQIPEAGKSIPRGGTVVLFTDKDSGSSASSVVPDFTGMTLSQANSRASDAGINISITGAALTGTNAIANSQSIAGGTKVKPGTVITVTFAAKNQV